MGVVGAVLAFLLAPLLGLVSWTFTTFRAEANRSIEQLRAENREQALILATLKASDHDARMLALLESLRDKFDAFGRALDRSSTIMDRLDRKLQSGGEYPAARIPR